MTDKKTTYTAEDIMWADDTQFKMIEEELDDSWRHGNYTHRVYLEVATGKHWYINGQETGDGEYCEYEPPVDAGVPKKVTQVKTVGDLLQKLKEAEPTFKVSVKYYGMGGTHTMEAPEGFFEVDSKKKTLMINADWN